VCKIIDGELLNGLRLILDDDVSPLENEGRRHKKVSYNSIGRLEGSAFAIGKTRTAYFCCSALKPVKEKGIMKILTKQNTILIWLLALVWCSTIQ